MILATQPTFIKATRQMIQAQPPVFIGASRESVQFGSVKPQANWNPFTWLFGQIHKFFERFAKTSLGQWVVKGLKKINNFLQAPKKEPLKPASPTPANPPPPTPPAPAQAESKTAPEIPEPQGEPQSDAAGATDELRQANQTQENSAPQKKVPYSELSARVLSEKLAECAEKQMENSQSQSALRGKLKILEGLKTSQTKNQETFQTGIRIQEQRKGADWQDVHVEAPSREAWKEAEAVIKKEVDKQKGLLAESQKAMALISQNIQKSQLELKKLESQFEDLECEIHTLTLWREVRAGIEDAETLARWQG